MRSLEIADGAMALVGDDEVELLDGNGGIVGDIARAIAQGLGEFRCGNLVGILGEFFAAKNRVEPLDGADRDAADIIDMR